MPKNRNLQSIEDFIDSQDFQEYEVGYRLSLDLAVKIKQYREKYKVPQSVLAKKMKVTQPFLSRLEKGKQSFSIKTLEKLYLPSLPKTSVMF